MRDLERTKRQILDRVELLDVVSEQVSLKRSGRRWVGLCPFHSEKTPSFTVVPEMGLFKCFGCGKGGDLFSFIQLRESVPFTEALQLLADRAGIDLAMRPSGPAGRGDRVDRPTLARVNQWAAGFFRRKLLDRAAGERAREYVRQRGIAEDIEERFSIGLAADAGEALLAAASRAGFSDAVLLEADLLRADESGRRYETFRNRLMFPIRDAMNRVIGFGGRTLVDDRAKYLNTRQNALFDKGRNLYGIDAARQKIAESGRAVLVEGYTDCIACHQAGVTEAVATLGTALTPEQASLLRRYCESLILLFDADEAGAAAAERALRLALPLCLQVKLARVPDGKDPCEYLRMAGGGGFSDLLNGAIDALEFQWLQTRRRFDADASAAQRQKAVMDFLQLVADASSSQAIRAMERGRIINQVAHLVQMSAEEVRGAFAALDKRRRHQAEPDGGPRSTRTPPTDAEQSAWTHLLEVGLNEPALLRTMERMPDVERIEDACCRRIARALVAAVDESPETQMADVLVRLQDVGDAARVEELTRRGAERGNFEATLRLAMERITLATQSRETDASRNWLLETLKSGRNPVGHDGDPTSETGGRRISEHKHFAPRRLIRRAVGAQMVVKEPANDGQ